jgi:predicted Rossmann fold nucleotide-binding protein DprA/Smf involved in DNA uptake
MLRTHRQVLNLLTTTPQHPDALAASAALTPGETRLALAMLEAARRATWQPGDTYHLAATPPAEEPTQR